MWSGPRFAAAPSEDANEYQRFASAIPADPGVSVQMGHTFNDTLFLFDSFEPHVVQNTPASVPGHELWDLLRDGKAVSIEKTGALTCPAMRHSKGVVCNAPLDHGAISAGLTCSQRSCRIQRLRRTFEVIAREGHYPDSATVCFREGCGQELDKDKALVCHRCGIGYCPSCAVVEAAPPALADFIQHDGATEAGEPLTWDDIPESTMPLCFACATANPVALLMLRTRFEEDSFVAFGSAPPVEVFEDAPLSPKPVLPKGTAEDKIKAA